MLHRVRCTAAAAACLVMASAGGCQTWLGPGIAATSPAAVAEPRPKPAPRTIPLEVVFIRHDEHDAMLGRELWNLVDEQALDRDLRRRLETNGLRAGVVTAQLPPHLAERFTPTPAVGESLPAGVPDDPALMRHVLRLLPGRSSDVMAATGLEPLVLMEHDGEGVTGTTYHDASPLFSLKAWPAADGRVRLKLSPMIKHGPIERSWVGEEGMFRLETGQRRDVLESLEFETVIPIGSMVLVGAAGEPASTAGDAFLRDRAGGSRAGQRLLAIRPISQPHASDPMFASADADEEAVDP